MRFYEIDKGEILVDGINIKDLSREDLRSIFAWCCRIPGFSMAASARISATAMKVPATKTLFGLQTWPTPITLPAPCQVGTTLN